jgi:hypothetical protein
VEQPFWLVWSPEGNSPTFKHPTFESAKAECERLANLNRGSRFYVLAPVGYSIHRTVEWVPVFSDGTEQPLPF